MSAVANIQPSIVKRNALCFMLLAVNIIGFIYQSYYIQNIGGDWLLPTDTDSYVFIILGANEANLTLTGEPWRLVSNIFLHADIAHLLFNLVALLAIGPYTEEHFGKLKMLAIYLVSGISASLVSALWYSSAGSQGNELYDSIAYSVFQTQILRINISVGASGAIMGLAGANLASMLAKMAATHQAEPQQKKHLNYTLIMVGLTLAYGLQKGVDSSAHIGGLISGSLFAGILLCCHAIKSKLIRSTLSLISIVAVAGLLLGAIQASQQPDSESMQDARETIMAKMAEYQQARALELQRSLAQLQIALDKQNRPDPVSAEVAAGIEIPIGGFADDVYQTADGRWLYASIGKNNQLIQIDLQKNNHLRTYSAPPLPKTNDGCPHNMCRGMGVSGIATSPDGKLIYVTSMQPDALSVLDTERGKIVKTLPLGQFPRAMLLTNDGKRAYVINSVDNTLSVINLQDYSIERVIAFAGGNAEHYGFGRQLAMALSPDEKWLAFANTIGSTVELINTETLEPLPIRENEAEILNVQSLRFLADNKQLRIVTDNTLLDISVPDRAITQQVLSCEGKELQNAVLNSDGTLIAVQTPSADHWLLVKISTRSVIGYYPLTTIGYGMKFSNNDGLLFDKGLNDIRVLDRDRSLDPQDTEITPLCFEDPNNQDDIGW